MRDTYVVGSQSTADAIPSQTCSRIQERELSRKIVMTDWEDVRLEATVHHEHGESPQRYHIILANVSHGVCIDLPVRSALQLAHWIIATSYSED